MIGRGDRVRHRAEVVDEDGLLSSRTRNEASPASTNSNPAVCDSGFAVSPPARRKHRRRSARLPGASCRLGQPP